MMILRTASFPYPNCLQLRFSVEHVEGSLPENSWAYCCPEPGFAMEKNVAQGPRYWRACTFRMSDRSRDFFTENTPSVEHLAAIALLRATCGASSETPWPGTSLSSNV